MQGFIVVNFLYPQRGEKSVGVVDFGKRTMVFK